MQSESSNTPGKRSPGLRSDGTPRRPNPKSRKRIPPPPGHQRPRREPQEWVRDEPVRQAPVAEEIVFDGPRPELDISEFEALATSKNRARTLAGRTAEAAQHFAAERFIDSRRILRPIVDELPGSPTVRELYGLTQYCLENWSDAARNLEVLREMPDYKGEQHPVLMDCYRALKRWETVDELWVELREASPSKDVIIEGRIVAAGALADRGNLKAAVAMLEDGWKAPKKPKPAHLSQAYALADLYERSGDLIKARTLMSWVATVAPGFSDAEQRVEAMG